MVIFVLLVEMMLMVLKVELKCVPIISGAQCVMTCGVWLMQEWSADNLATL